LVGKEQELATEEQIGFKLLLHNEFMILVSSLKEQTKLALHELMDAIYHDVEYKM